jgi:calcineurin-like phosphoesterase family protein
MGAWFTADLHFGHKAVLHYSNRPYADLDEMKMMITSTWNRHIRPHDDVYVLGDFSFERKEIAQETFKALNGRKHLIIGNHDGDHIRKLPWETVSQIKTFRGEGYRIVLCHYPMLTWDRAHHGVWHLHGHSHGNLKWLGSRTTRMDVGIDCHPEHRPFSLSEVAISMEQRKYAPVDHHVEDHT